MNLQARACGKKYQPSREDDDIVRVGKGEGGGRGGDGGADGVNTQRSCSNVLFPVFLCSSLWPSVVGAKEQQRNRVQLGTDQNDGQRPSSADDAEWSGGTRHEAGGPQPLQQHERQNLASNNSGTER